MNVLTMLTNFIPLIPSLISAGLTTYDAYSKVQKIIDENRKPSEPEWDELEAQIKKDQATLHDTTKD